MRLINFLDYKILLNYLLPISNFLFILNIPNSIANEILDRYIIFSILANGISLLTLSSKSKWSISISIALFVFSLFLFIESSILCYGLLIVQFDYIISLLKKRYFSDLFKNSLKFIYILTGFLFLLHFHLGLYIRIIFITTFLSFIYFSRLRSDISKLNIDRSLLHIIVTHVAYWSPLYLITLIEFNRVWYVAIQINLFIILRFIDTYIKDFISLNFLNAKNLSLFFFLVSLEVVLLQIYFPVNKLFPFGLISSVIVLMLYTVYLSKTGLNES